MNDGRISPLFKKHFNTHPLPFNAASDIAKLKDISRRSTMHVRSFQGTEIFFEIVILFHTVLVTSH